MLLVNEASEWRRKYLHIHTGARIPNEYLTEEAWMESVPSGSRYLPTSRIIKSFLGELRGEKELSTPQCRSFRTLKKEDDGCCVHEGERHCVLIN